MSPRPRPLWEGVKWLLRTLGRLGEMIRAQKETVGLNRGAKGSRARNEQRGSKMDPRPTLAAAGIDSHRHEGEAPPEEKRQRTSWFDFDEESAADAERWYRQHFRWGWPRR